MTLAYTSLLDTIEEECERILVTAEQDLSWPVRTCPGWSLDDLVRHVADVLHRGAAQARAADATTRARPEPLGDEGAIRLLEVASEELVGALRAREPEDESWNFTGEDMTAGFLARRYAHEVAIHRVDAELVRSRATPFDLEFAVDGIDERLQVMLPFMLKRAGDISLAGSICLICSDDPAAWVVDVDHGALRLRRGRGPADAAIVGRASDLFCYVWNRPVRHQLEVTGRREVVDSWGALPG